MVKQYDDTTLKKLQAVEVSILKDIIKVCNKFGIEYFIMYGSLIGAIRHHGFIPWDDDVDISMFRDDYEKFVQVFDKELGEKYNLATPLRKKGYASAIIKVEKKGTTFISAYSKDMKCEQGIFVDIFVYDKVSSNKRIYRSQIIKARLLSMLLFLAGSPNPEINIAGIKGRVARVICKCIHYALKLCPDVRRVLYKQFVKNSVRANSEKTSKYTTYQSTAPDEDVADIGDILPCHEVPFEDIEVKIPKNYDYILRKIYGDYMQLPPKEERINHAADIIDFGDGR